MIMSDKILNLRKKLSLTQEELAEKLNVSRQSISKWESGQSIPDIPKIIAMSELFSVSTDYLLRDEIENFEKNDDEIKLDFKNQKAEIIDIETVDSFIENYKKHLKQVGIGVFFFIFGVVPLISLQVFVGKYIQQNIANGIGISFLFISLIIGIGFCIYSDNTIKEYNFIFSGDFKLSYDTIQILKNHQKKYQRKRTNNIIISIALIILPVLLIVIFGVFAMSKNVLILTISFLLICVAIAVFKLIYGEGKWGECYEMLLFEGEFKNLKNKKTKKQIIRSIYWSVAVAIYLIWSFMSNNWGITWLVFPIAGLLSTVLNLINVNDSQ